jgi:hypothetical protein
MKRPVGCPGTWLKARAGWFRLPVRGGEKEREGRTHREWRKKEEEEMCFHIRDDANRSMIDSS